jgi:hypothetical protein
MKLFQHNEIEITPENEAEYTRLSGLLANMNEPTERIRLLGQFSGICRTLGKYKESISASEEAVELTRQTGNKTQEAANLI